MNKMEEDFLEKIGNYEQAFRKLEELAEGVKKNLKVVYRLFEGCEVPTLKIRSTVNMEIKKEREEYTIMGRSSDGRFELLVSPKKLSVGSRIFRNRERYDNSVLEVKIREGYNDEKWVDLKTIFARWGARISSEDSGYAKNAIIALVNFPVIFLENLNRLDKATKEIVPQYTEGDSKLKQLINFNTLYLQQPEKFMHVFEEFNKEEQVMILQGIIKAKLTNLALDKWLDENYKAIVEAAGLENLTKEGE